MAGRTCANQYFCSGASTGQVILCSLWHSSRLPVDPIESWTPCRDLGRSNEQRADLSGEGPVSGPPMADQNTEAEKPNGSCGPPNDRFVSGWPHQTALPQS